MNSLLKKLTTGQPHKKGTKSKKLAALTFFVGGSFILIVLYIVNH